MARCPKCSAEALIPVRVARTADIYLLAERGVGAGLVEHECVDTKGRRHPPGHVRIPRSAVVVAGPSALEDGGVARCRHCLAWGRWKRRKGGPWFRAEEGDEARVHSCLQSRESQQREQARLRRDESAQPETSEEALDRLRGAKTWQAAPKV